MSDEKLNYEFESQEPLGAEDERVRRLCGGLKRVAAPTDFDFRVKAKIARTREHEQSAPPRLFPVLRYILPVVLILAVGFFAAFNFIPGGDETAGLPANETIVAPQSAVAAANVETSAPPAAAAAAPVESFSAAPSVIASPAARSTSGVEYISVKSAPAPRRTPQTAPRAKSEFGGTITSTSRDVTVILPPGISARPETTTIASDQTAAQISIKDVLSNIGIEADFAGSEWRVKTVSENTAASRAGIKSGDIINAADDRRLNAEAIAERTLTMKTLHITRDGKKMSVELK